MHSVGDKSGAAAFYIATDPEGARRVWRRNGHDWSELSAAEWDDPLARKALGKDMAGRLKAGIAGENDTERRRIWRGVDHTRDSGSGARSARATEGKAILDSDASRPPSKPSIVGLVVDTASLSRSLPEHINNPTVRSTFENMLAAVDLAADAAQVAGVEAANRLILPLNLANLIVNDRKQLARIPEIPSEVASTHEAILQAQRAHLVTQRSDHANAEIRRIRMDQRQQEQPAYRR